MKSPVSIIEGAKLMERWSMSPVDLFMMMSNHQLPYIGRMVGNKDWFELHWNDVLRWVLKEKKDISDFVFELADVLRIEKEYGELTSVSNKLLRGEELMKRWDNTDMEIIDMIDNGFLNPVDPVDVPMDDFHVEFMLADRFATTTDLLFRISDVEGLEQQYPDLKAFKQKETSSTGKEGGLRKTQEKPESDNVPIISFYKNGQIWLIGERGREKLFEHLKGLDQIWMLVTHQEREKEKDKEIDAITLYNIAKSPEDPPDEIPGHIPPGVEVSKAKVLMLNDVDEEEEKGSYASRDSLEVIDRQTLEAVKCKLERIEEQIVVTTDSLKRLEYQDVQKQLRNYLCMAMQNPSKIRSFKSTKEENCRINVQKNIARAIGKIHQENPIIKKYINNKTIVTGNKCYYRKDPHNPVKWALEPSNS